ncbi:hypothetical protein ACI2KR_26405 [Pseudomonas luteola]
MSIQPAPLKPENPDRPTLYGRTNQSDIEVFRFEQDTIMVVRSSGSEAPESTGEVDTAALQALLVSQEINVSRAFLLCQKHPGSWACYDYRCGELSAVRLLEQDGLSVLAYICDELELNEYPRELVDQMCRSEAGKVS